MANIRNADFDSEWNKIKDELKGFMDGTTKIKCDTFMSANTLCIKNPYEIYENLELFMSQRIQSSVEILVRGKNEETIDKFLEEWRVYESKSGTLDDIFNYINKNYAERTKCKSVIDLDNMNLRRKYYAGELSYRLWALASHDIKDILIKGLQKKFRIMPDVNTDDFRDFSTFICVVQIISTYSYDDSSLLESVLAYYFNVIRDYYKILADSMTNSLSPEEYLSKCLDLIKTAPHLTPNFIHMFEKIIVETIIEDQLHFIMSNTMDWFQCSQFEPLNHLLHLRWYCPKIGPVFNDIFRNYLKVRYQENKTKSRGKNDIIDLCRFLKSENSAQMTFVLNHFKGETETLQIVSEEFCSAIVKMVKVSELAKCWHNLIAGVFQETNQDFILDVTRNLDMDGLEQFKIDYLLFLSERLLYFTDVSLPQEEHFFYLIIGTKDNLTEEKYIKMITDVNESQNHVDEFSRCSNEVPSCPFKVSVLRQATWPIVSVESKDPTLIIPSALRCQMERFENFYKTKTKRKFTWCHSLSRCQLELNYLGKRYTMDTSLYLYLVLNVFNDRDSAIFPEIQESVGLEQKELSKCIKFLIGKKILSCQAKCSSNGHQRFFLNMSYERRKETFQMLMSPEAEEKVVKSKMTGFDKTLYLEALIVKTMKDKKRVKHDHLIEEIEKISKQRVPIKRALIESVMKKCIELQFMKQADDDNSAYIYVP